MGFNELEEGQEWPYEVRAAVSALLRRLPPNAATIRAWKHRDDDSFRVVIDAGGKTASMRVKSGPSSSSRRIVLCDSGDGSFRELGFAPRLPLRVRLEPGSVPPPWSPRSSKPLSPESTRPPMSWFSGRTGMVRFRDPDCWHLWADLLALASLVERHGRELALYEPLGWWLPPDALNGHRVLSGPDDKVVEAAQNENLYLVSIAVGVRWTSGMRLPSEPSKRVLDHIGHAEVLAYTTSPSAYPHYQQIRLRGPLLDRVAMIRHGEMFDADDQVISGLVNADTGRAQRVQAKRLTPKPPEPVASPEPVAPQADIPAIVVPSTVRRDPYPQDLDPEHRRFNEIFNCGDVLWEWWVPDGLSSGPMTREYGEAVIHHDGRYWYVMFGDAGDDEWIPLKGYRYDHDAVAAGKMHSLYSEEERNALDADAYDDDDG